MSERFERWNDHSCKVKDNQESILLGWEDVVKKLNEQQAIITELNKQIEQLNLAIDDLLSHTNYDEIKKENEQLRKQIQNYEQLISNLYVGEEETLDGWIGKYEIWETDLQKYKEKIKGVCYEQ